MHTHLGRAVAALLIAAFVLLHPPAAGAADRVATTLAISAPASARPGTTVQIQATLTASGPTPVPNATVILERLEGEGWTPLATSATGASGVADFSLQGNEPEYVLRARYSGDASHEESISASATVRFAQVGSALTVSGPGRLVDERTGTLTIRWTGSDGLPIAGAVTAYSRVRNGSWSKLRNLSTGSDGRAAMSVRPRVDTWYQFRGAASSAWRAPASPTWKIDNVPPLAAVRLPAAAPRPAALPAQRRAVGGGANVSISRIPDSVWRRMDGRTWHSGCPVGRGSLRYLTVNYWGFDGYRHRGELVVRDRTAGKFAVAMTKLYRARVPIRSMYLADRFGGSDVRSMRHDNTSAFNCRWVTGRPGVRSPHSYGGSIDINPWENPFHSRVGWLPNSWWSAKQAGKYAWKSRSHLVVRLMAQAGFRWTYGRSDSQHFDG